MGCSSDSGLSNAPTLVNLSLLENNLEAKQNLKVFGQKLSNFELKTNLRALSDDYFAKLHTLISMNIWSWCALSHEEY